MNAHLSAQEFVDALEGTLPDARQAHLTACDTCARQVAELTGVTRQAEHALDVPPPSPLFWEHFSARVRTATDAETIRRESWWERAWRPVIAASAAAAVILIVMLTTRTGVPAPPSDPMSASASVPAPNEQVLDDASMDFMVQIAATVSNDDLQAARPGRAATAAAIDELTPDQQAEFIRLIKAEIGDPQ
jgi:hypothetical protein